MWISDTCTLKRRGFPTREHWSLPTRCNLYWIFERVKKHTYLHFCCLTLPNSCLTLPNSCLTLPNGKPQFVMQKTVIKVVVGYLFYVRCTYYTNVEVETTQLTQKYFIFGASSSPKFQHGPESKSGPNRLWFFFAVCSSCFQPFFNRGESYWTP